MNKRKLITRIAEVLRDNEIKKYVAPQKTILHISDDCGGSSNFVVKRSETGLQYTIDDITVILDACMAIIEDALKNGEEVSIQGFGTLGIRRRAPRMTAHPVTGEIVDISERYVPRFSPGKNLKNATAVYSVIAEQKLKEADAIVADGSSVDDEEEDEYGCD